MKILVISSESPESRTGLGRLVNAEVAGLRKRGHTVETVFPDKSRKTELKFTSVSWHRFSGFEMIHVYGPSPMISDLALFRNQPLPHVYSHVAEVVWLNDFLSSIYRKGHSLLARHARLVLVMTRDYARLFGMRARVLAPPITFKPPQGTVGKRKAERFTVLFVGQMRPFKGIDVLLDSARMLPHVNWVISGRGWAQGRYLDVIRTIPNVAYKDVSTQEELAQLYEQAHVIAVPSINTTEAFSLVATEAALFGCVPVASDLLGVRENIQTLRGFTFPTKSAQGLASIVNKLSRDTDLWAEKSKECRGRATAYANENTPESYAAKHEELFKLVA